MPDIPNVLVVDDDPDICKYLKDILSRKRYKTTIVDCGREAIKSVNQTDYDIVLLDLSLPDIEGYKVMVHIKQKNPETIVIIITGFASIESAIKTKFTDILKELLIFISKVRIVCCIAA